MVSRPLDDRVKGPGGLRLGRDRLVANGARGQLDHVPGQDVRGNELGERRERAPAELALSPGFDDRPSEPVCGAHVGVSEPGHGVTGEHTPHGAQDSRGAEPDPLTGADRPLSPASPRGREPRPASPVGFRWSVE